MSYPLFTLSWQLILAVLCCTVALIARYAVAGRRPKNFPPGPPSWPVIGNLHQLPLKKPFTKFHEWSKEYGPIVGLKFGPQNVVVLNSYVPVRDLFDKRGGIYSSRPDNYIGNELICPDETHILLVPYGQGWRALRKAVQAMLNTTAVDGLLPIQEAEASQTLYQLLHQPKECFKHIRRYSTAVILASVYGQRGASYNAPKVQALYHAQEQFTEMLAPGGAPPVDAFPFLQYLPAFLSPWRSQAKAIRKEQRDLYSALLDETKARMQRQDRTPCFMEKLIEGQAKSGLTDTQIVQTGGILMEAGSDTTASTLLSFILAMLAYPNVLKKLQKELDGVCGVERSPLSEEVRDLPYLRAVMTETLRWRPVAPGGIPHMLTQDDWYDEYFLPKGTIVFANTWSIHRDESEYQSPDQFIPERYLNEKFGTKVHQELSTDDDYRRVTYSFGAGRRVCPGQRLSENSLIVNMAKIAWAFDISADPSAPANMDVRTGYSDGFVFSPNTFSAIFTPRSEKHREIIEQDYARAGELFRKYGD